jgi:hypothetical protein
MKPINTACERNYNDYFRKGKIESTRKIHWRKADDCHGTDLIYIEV